jgi:hypothetical protein
LSSSKQHKNLVLQPTYQLWRALGGVLAKQVDTCNKGKQKREGNINERIRGKEKGEKIRRKKGEK